MRTVQGRFPRTMRTLFVSDTHLGCRHAHIAELLELLNHVHPQRIYLVGDIIDGWKLRKGMNWKSSFNDVLARLYELHTMGTRIYYTPGNHDAFMRHFSWNFGFMKVADEFVHRTADGRRFLVTHGDKFDRVECSARWVSTVASIGYDSLLSANRLVSRWRGRPAAGAYCFSNRIKRVVKQAVKYISDFEQRLADHARQQACDGVICGHIHTPAITEYHGVIYCNTGDWIENCTAMIENDEGELSLIRYFEEAHETRLCSPARAISRATNRSDDSDAFASDEMLLSPEASAKYELESV